MNSTRARLIEGEARGDDGHRPAGVTARAETFAVARFAHSIGARGGRRVVIRKIRIVDEVIVGQRALVLQVAVTGIAVLRCEFGFVTVAAQTIGHLGAHDGRAAPGVGVTSDAIGARLVGVLTMIEAKRCLRAKRACAGIR
jgi:hypothetical protein